MKESTLKTIFNIYQDNQGMRLKLILAFILVLGLAHLSFAKGKMYKWKDDKGITHFTDDPGSIPLKYKKQSSKGSLKDQIVYYQEAIQKLRERVTLKQDEVKKANHAWLNSESKTAKSDEKKGKEVDYKAVIARNNEQIADAEKQIRGFQLKIKNLNSMKGQLKEEAVAPKVEKIETVAEPTGQIIKPKNKNPK